MTAAVRHSPGTGLAPLLDVFCPMHAILTPGGLIRHAGPALARLAPQGRPLEGTPLLDLLTPLRPHGAPDLPALLAHAGARLHFALRDPPRTELKGVIVPLPDALPDALPERGATPAGPGRSGAVLNLSFGISIVDAVRDFALTGADFAVTDLAVEMLYLVEAQSAVMDELRRLNSRLNGARLDAEVRATTDMLTGLGNRRAMERVLEEITAQERGFSLMHLDLDFFKQVNDRFGHAAGDHVLQVAARRLVAALRGQDVVIRVGGDEFLIILPGMTDPGAGGCHRLPPDRHARKPHLTRRRAASHLGEHRLGHLPAGARRRYRGRDARGRYRALCGQGGRAQGAPALHPEPWADRRAAGGVHSPGRARLNTSRITE